MTRKAALAAAILLVATAAAAQVKVQLPPLTITGSTLESSVSYDVARGVYPYDYAVVAAKSNQADIDGFDIDISGTTDRPQLDPDLRNNIERDELTLGQIQPNTAIPVGITVPAPYIKAGVNSVSYVAFPFFGAGNKVGPGERVKGIRLESKQPPAWRDATLMVSSTRWIPILRSFPKGADVEFNYGTPSEFDLHTKVLAPYDLDESTLFLGGGQSPREVNPFLRYVAPTESRVHLPAGTAKYDVTLLYGRTTDPATFSATLDGTDITSQFRPMAGVVDTVTIPLKPGTTKLEISIQGKTSSGRVARDMDTLTFVVK